jgi:NAD(P)-dependent dehydrogenase (short-subunit alcohol dehydrogenase family)
MTEPSWSRTCYTDILEGLSESLAREVSEFGMRVLVVEPGAFRTRFLQSCIFPQKETTRDYIGNTVGNTLKYFEGLNGTQLDDPVKMRFKHL